jgi:hypothetical protein
MYGWQWALAQWQRRVATVREALWWWVRGGGDDRGPPHKVEPPSPVEGAVDWRM